MTRSGSYDTMASMFGVKPERSVIGASGGKLDWSSTATTWSPAPMAERISVATDDRETIRSGRSTTATSPLSAVTVTGNAPAPVVVVDAATVVDGSVRA